ncbi:MAG: DUF6531 domain-containing protein, partial [Pseudomonadales bacterium]
MRQGLLPATEYLSRRFRFSPQAYASRACLLVFALQSTQLAASRPPVWGYQMYLGPGEFKVFSDASAAASFGCSNINNTSNSAVENVTQTGINLSISCSFDNVNGDRSYGAARPASWGPACPAGMAFNGEVCEGFDENKKKPCPDPSSGNPIRTLTGVKVQRETDINTKAPAGIKFERIFDSRTAFAAGISLGPHWRHNFDAVLRFTFRPLAGVSEPVNLQGCNTITDFSGAGATQSGFCAASALQSNAIVQLDGAILERAEVGLSYFSYRDGKWQAAPGSGEQLEELLDNNGLSRWRYRNMSGLAETFNDIGKLVERSENGMRYDLEYAMPVTEGGDGDSSTLDRVSSAAGEEMRFTYEEGLLASVVDAAGARYQYAYTEGDNAAGLRQLEHVSYPDLTPAAAGNNPWGEDNPFRSYHYEHGTFKYNLTGITNENRLRYVSWDYNPQRRAILSRRA